MRDDAELLVVDDEEAICEACRRVFSRQGFRVEKTNNANEGLRLASERDFSAVLLDIKMPELDGIQFLERLRVQKPDLPVILMTGYPSIPNAVSALRLGASEYVTKPFTPEEISRAVHKCVGRPAAEHAGVTEPWSPTPDGASFLGESWAAPGKDGTVRAGAMLPQAQAAAVTAIRLPSIGEVVYQGLPLAALSLADGTTLVVPTAVSGVVLSVNEALPSGAAAMASDPCGAGWIATISPTRFEDEVKKCSRRRVILLNTDLVSAHVQAERLAALGCHVRTVTRREDLTPMLDNPDYPVLVMDAAGFGPGGPAVVAQIHAAAPSTRVVLVAPLDRELESAYRAERVFYYAVEPFADNEIADVLTAAFRTPALTPHPADRRHTPPGPLSTILITNHNGNRVMLAATPGLLRREAGLGAALRHKLLDRLFPVETVSDDADLSPYYILRMAAACDRLVVLVTKDMNRLPGSLVRDTKSEFISISGEDAGKVTFQVVQPGPDGGLDELPAETTDALAEHLIADLASY